MKNYKNTLLSLSCDSLFHLPLFADTVGVSKSSFVSGLILGKYQILSLQSGYIILEHGRFVPEYNSFYSEKDFLTFITTKL